MPLSPELYIHCEFQAVATQPGRWPVLEKMLARGSRAAPSLECTAGGLESLLRRSLAPGGGTEAPLAALSLLGEGLDPEGRYWLRADPVQLVANRDQLIMAGSEPLQLTRAEAEALIAALRELYADTAWRWELGREPHRWYLGLEQASETSPDIRTVAPGRVIGQHILHHVPGGPDGLRWQALMTEIQSALHLSPVNAEREQHDRPTANSVWFWGGGRLAQERPQEQDGTDHVPWVEICSGDPLLTGLGRYAGRTVSPLPADAAHCLAQSHSGATLLDLATDAMAGAPGSLEEYLDQVHEHWLKGMARALRSGIIETLVLTGSDGQRCTLNRRQWRKWWLRRAAF